MVSHLKMTLNIDDSVMQRLREESVRYGTTMSTLVEAGIRRVLATLGRKLAGSRPASAAVMERWKGVDRHLGPGSTLPGRGRGMMC